MIQAWMLALAFTSSVLEQHPNDAAIERIKALRAQELEELQAASRARQMQHELAAAAAQQQIQQLGLSATPSVSAGPALSAYQLLAVVGGDQHVVLLKHQQQLLRLVPGESDASGLMASIDGEHVRLQRGHEQRLLALPRGW